ncbi:hypothetical protein M0811_04023 [Anaeramoeba ignava]|uniref:Alpha N-terminal protein methyltransferase 1 n=1 Tax=Anaeramoeba ignava TaxID=1746090 RepID=A0A9Q0LVA5_ANAIG|nr:hypothetical protein M0811_04023 [Anaeramoeba ignava]
MKEKEKEIEELNLEELQEQITGKDYEKGIKIDNFQTIFEKEKDWYSKSKKYWAKAPATINGMLIGYEHIAEKDHKHSIQFLEPFVSNLSKTNRCALDCACGIGRITKNVLMPFFDFIDLVDSEERFLKEAEKNFSNSGKIMNYFCSPLEKFIPESKKYDLIWIQWVLVYFKDEDLVNLLEKCQSGLKENGLIIIKDETSFDDQFLYFEEDNYLVRSSKHYKAIFQKVGLEVLNESEIDFGDPTCGTTIFALK